MARETPVPPHTPAPRCALPPITTMPALPYTARYDPSSHSSVITPGLRFSTLCGYGRVINPQQYHAKISKSKTN